MTARTTLIPLFWCLATGLALIPAGAQETGSTVLTIDTTVRLATTGNPDLIALERAVDDARDALGWEAYRDDVSLALGASVTGTTLEDMVTAGDATLGVAVEILPQLTVSGELTGRVSTDGTAQTDPLGASLGLTFLPLADAQSRSRDEIALREAEFEFADTARAVSYAALETLLAAVEVHARVPLAETALDLAERRLETIEALAARDRATGDDVDAASDDARGARQAVARISLTARRATLQVAQTTGLAEAVVVLPSWEDLDLELAVQRIDARRASVDRDATREHTKTVMESLVALETARVEQAATRRFTPELSATAGVSFPGHSYSLGLSFKVRPSDWDGSARVDAARYVRFAEASYEDALETKRLDLELALLSLDQAFENLGAAGEDVALARLDLREAAFRFERGDATRLALDRARYDLAIATNAVNIARAAIVQQWYAIDLARF